MLLDHSPILQARIAKKAAGPRAQSASQVQVIQSTASGVFICLPPRKTAEIRKFQKNGGVLPPCSTPSHSRQTDRAADPSLCTKKGGSYLALLSLTETLILARLRQHRDHSHEARHIPHAESPHVREVIQWHAVMPQHGLSHSSHPALDLIQFLRCQKTTFSPQFRKRIQPSFCGMLPDINPIPIPVLPIVMRLSGEKTLYPASKTGLP